MSPTDPAARAAYAFAIPLNHEALDPGQLLDGAPTTAATALGEAFGLEYGLWEMSVGTMRDVEAEELFVVLSGSVTVTIHAANGYAESELALQPGTICQLDEGMHTSWVVHEPLRKVYLARP
ncbi:cupin domain-containing protein [Arthrobacter sp. HY1533]|uniref:cupin domain-containing protein n=1 Tax=Arthrobacter sp. HY1533 TaxID=2970919 RepID=UPI0022B9FC24|nr:cupin domain-containing protein [Arthrobacter sp. HY1533]